MQTQPYPEQNRRWPQAERVILARHDADSLWVYQAYRPAIARYAVQHQRFGGEFSYSRMSWIKPNFLWMMYRSGWATKEGQEHVLAVRLSRQFFDGLLRQAVASTWHPETFASREEWQAAVANSEVRLQWDPDHDPAGQPVERRAVQLGLRGSVLREYGQSCLAIEDVTPFVAAQRGHATGDFSHLLLPVEDVYTPAAPGP